MVEWAMSEPAIVPRKRWGADPLESPWPIMSLPATEVWIHHTVTGVTNDPAADWKMVQKIGIQKFGDISYSWGFHPSGIILEGQGLHRGAHTAKRNSRSFGLALIGNYDRLQITIEQIHSIQRMIAWLVETGRLRKGIYPTGGHRDTGQATACPGKTAYAAIPTMRQPFIPAPPAPQPCGRSPIVVNAPVVGIMTHPSWGNGSDSYIEVGADGGTFSFGQAPNFGSLGATKLNKPCVGGVVTKTGLGYWLVAQDGGVFGFGDAEYKGGVEWPG